MTATTQQKFYVLINELLSTHPAAIRQNAVRLGLVTEANANLLSAQSLSSAIVVWSKQNNASNDATKKMLTELLSVEAATAALAREASGETTETTKEDPSVFTSPQWLQVLFGVCLVLGLISLIRWLGNILSTVAKANA
jgi:hypothetical protein